MDDKQMWKLERLKGVARALAELDIALNTIYSDREGYDDLKKVYDQLKEYKHNYLD